MNLPILSCFYKKKEVAILLILGFQIISCHGQYPSRHNIHILEAYSPSTAISSHVTHGDHISDKFFMTANETAHAKNELQALLHNFLENLQRNLTTSIVLNTVVNTIDVGKTKRQVRRLHDLANFFVVASEKTTVLATEVQEFFDVTKNESNALLMKLRRVPTGQRLLPMQVKVHLTNYFTEMEFFHVSFSEIIDETLEYIVDTLHSTQRTFIRYADIQNDVLHNWNFKPDEWCCNRYMDFLQHWSAEIFRCAAGIELHTAYDIYAMTEVTAKYILRQQEFRIQRLFNCFLFAANYQIRCRFLHNAEADFEKLFAKLDELQMYFDIKTKRGRITSYRISRNRRELEENSSESSVTDMNDLNTIVIEDKCIPYGFPDTQMLSSLKACFYFLDSDFN